MWNLDPPPGFQGLREDLPLTVYERRLPHWRQDGATYFVTMRLCDSLPQAKLRELDAIREEWARLNPRPRSNAVLEQLARQLAERVERWLDQGFGRCLLARPSLAAHLTCAMHHFDGERYELCAYVVMPNHAHAIVRPTHCTVHSLEGILGSWKQYSSGRMNAELGEQGARWQEESFDRIVRDQEHLYRAVQYIGRNARLANLPEAACPRWIRPEWERLGWTFERFAT